MRLSKTSLVWLTTWALVAASHNIDEAVAADNLFQGDVSADWATAANWSLNSPTGFVPRGSGGFNQRAVIGTDDQDTGGALAGITTLSTLLPVNNQTIHGLALGLRELDYTVTPPAFINPAPAAGTLTGSLTISGATTILKNEPTGTPPTFPAASVGADGRILVGVDGRGYLTMTGGTLTGQALIVAGENITTGGGTSLVDLRGASTLTIFGGSTFNRRLRVEGPSVNFNTAGQLRLNSTNTYTAAITSATAHSALKTANNAFLGGTLNVEFSGAAATRDPIATLGQTWDLVDSSLSENAIAGSFTNLGANGEVQVSGLDAAHAAPLGTTYRVKSVAAAGHSVLQLVYDRILILTVNRDTGQLSIRNPYGGNIAIDGYSVSSPLGSLVTSYTGIGVATPGAGTWVKPTDGIGQPLNTANVLTELQEPDFTPPITNTPFDLTSVPTVGLGVGFNRQAVAGNVLNFGTDGEDLVFEYTGPAGTVRGQIEYVGAKFENNLVLRVNPTTGQAFLKNDSLETVSFDGYSILSSTGALSGAGFTGLGGTWQSSPATANALTQTNLTGATTLAPGASAAIGDISATGFTTEAAQAGLSMQFILSDNLAGDYNGNGTVDSADYVLWRNGGPLQDEGITPGAVSPEDYTVWRAFFGAGPESTFRVGSIVFDPLAGAGSGSALVGVPEPSAAWLFVVGFVGLLFVGRSRFGKVRRELVPATVTQRTSGEVGARIMSGRLAHFLLGSVGVCLAAASALPAAAQTHGFTLANFDFEQPGPPNVKAFAFDELGVPIAGAIPGWTFNGPGVETFGHPERIGDSGTEGGGNPGQEMILSTHDGIAYQTATGFNIHSITANQTYKFSFDAHDIFTINSAGAGVANGAELTVRYYYGAARTTLATQVIHPMGDHAHYELLIPNSSLPPAAIGQPLGIEFDTTSTTFNAMVDKSWVGVDNVVLQVTGVLRGDLNGDGLRNSTDYAILRDNLQEAHPFESDGELTGDGFVDLNDFRRLKSLVAGAGSASGAADSGSVPEPATWLLTLLASAAVCGPLVRRCRSGLSRTHALVVVCVGIGAVLSAATPSIAALRYYDPFLIGSNPAAGEYSLGFVDPYVGTPPPPGVAQDPNNGQNPTIGPEPFFTGAWQIRNSDGNAPNQQVVAQGLSFLGSPSAGGAVTTVPNTMTGDNSGRVGRFLSTPWTSTTNGTFYLSFLASFGTAADPNSIGDAGHADLGFRTVEFWPEGGAVGNDSGRSEIGYNGFDGSNGEPDRIPATARLRFVTPGGGGSQFLTETPFNTDGGATHLLVMKFVLSDQPASDTVAVFLDPTTVIEPIVANGTATNVDFTLSAMSTISRFGNSSPTMLFPVFDELRVGDAFIDVLPEFPLPGDTNSDDLVDMADYLNILHAMNLVGGAIPNTPSNHPDVNGDGKMTIADYRLWKDNRSDDGAGAALGAGGVPEPSTAILALAALALAGCVRRAIHTPSPSGRGPG